MNCCASAVTLSSFIKEERRVSQGAKIRNRYNQVPHLTQDTNGKPMSILSGVFLLVATSCCCLPPSPIASLASYIGVLGNISDSFCIKLSLSKLSLSMFFSLHVGQLSLGVSSYLVHTTIDLCSYSLQVLY